MVSKKVLMVITTVIEILAIIFILLATIIQGPIRSIVMGYGHDNLPFVFPLDSFLSAIINAGFYILIMVLMFLPIKTPVLGIVASVTRTIIAVFSPFMTMLITMIFSGQGSEVIASYSSLNSAINMIISPLNMIAMALFFIACGIQIMSKRVMDAEYTVDALMNSKSEEI